MSETGRCSSCTRIRIIKNDLCKRCRMVLPKNAIFEEEETIEE